MEQPPTPCNKTKKEIRLNRQSAYRAKRLGQVRRRVYKELTFLRDDIVERKSLPAATRDRMMNVEAMFYELSTELDSMLACFERADSIHMKICEELLDIEYS